MPKSSVVVVQLGPHQLEMRDYPIPSVGEDDALLRVERCGICGSDVEQFDGAFSWIPFPVIPGHEPVGIVEDIGPIAAKRWGLEAGDRVAVESAVPCMACRYCSRAEFNICPNRKNIGYVSIDEPPTLWGGYSEYLHLPANALVHKISSDLPIDVAAVFNPLAGGIEWGAKSPGTKLGDFVVVLGCGQRGIAAALAAKAVGASTTVITGLNRDVHKLKLALELGVDHAINVETDDVRALVAEYTAGVGADIVIDLVPVAASTVVDALDLVRVGGTVVLAGVKGDVAATDLYTDQIPMKAITVRGVRGKSFETYEQTIALMESRRFPLERLSTHTFGLSEAEKAIEVLAGRVPGEDAVFVSLDPRLGL